MSMTYLEKIQVAQETVVGFGGVSLSNPAPSMAFGSKKYMTAVGEQEAVFYLTPGDGINQTFNGNYGSVNHNILGGCGILVPIGATSDRVKELCAQFLVACEKQIDGSYARGLYLEFGIGRNKS